MKVLLAALCWPASPAISGPNYDIIDLGVLTGAAASEAHAINNKGEVVGWYHDGTNRHAFLWSDGIMTELPDYLGADNSAEDINDAGQVVGQSWNTGAAYYAVLWNNGVPGSIGDLGGNVAWAVAINNAGDIIGQSFFTADQLNSASAFLRPAGGAMQGIGPVGRIFWQVNDINNLGQVAGLVVNRDVTNSFRGIVYDGGAVANLDKPVGSLWSVANGINDSGHVVGSALFQYPTFTATRAMLYKDTTWIDFYGGAPSQGVVINNLGDILGTQGSSPLQPVLWRQGQFQALQSLLPPASGWNSLTFAYDLNDSGQIVGIGIRNGENRAFLLTPHWYRLKIYGPYGDSLPGKTVSITRVNNNSPSYTERVVGNYVVDPAGVVEFKSDSISPGERFKVTLDVAEVPAVKHTGITTTKYHVYLDNVMFDSLGRPKFDTLVFTSDTQEVFIDHTTFVYDFVASIEWDADLSLIADFENSFRSMANYMYDVTDGQARLGSVYLYDNGAHWREADIHFRASNQVHPHVADVGGIDRTGASGDPVEMPRKWFGSKDATRNGTWSEWPLQMDVSGQYRTILHEVGHYAWGLKDEYRYDSGDVRCAAHVNSSLPFGFMDYQYDNGTDYCSEMSSEISYSNVACRNNFQWNLYAMSCWSLFEHNMERAYGPDSIGVVVNMPEERVLPDGLGFLAGPNNSSASLDYDVGALVSFSVSHTAPVRGNIIVSCWDAAGDSVPNSDVNLHYAVGGVGKQGFTSDLGRIRVLDYLPGDTIKTTAARFVTGSRAAGGALTKRWLFGMLDPSGQAGRYHSRHVLSAADDSVAIIMNEVFGYYPIVFAPTYANGDLSLTSWTPAAFSQTPAVEHQPDDLPPAPLSVTAIANGYSALWPTPATSGDFQFDALDDSAFSFFAPVAYVHSVYDTAVTALQASSSEGDAEIVVETAGAGIPSITMASSSYPVIMDGLGSLARQAGDAHGVAFGGVESVSGTITLHYSNSDVESSEQELTLEVHRFDDSVMQWSAMGGSVDTFHNEVVHGITEPGVYALFSTSVPTGVNDPPSQGNLPQRFELSQNYPNPFNPVTTISYSVASPSQVTIEVFNILGRKVRTLVDEMKQAGSYRIEWNGHDEAGKPVSTGVYLYRFSAGDVMQTKKMLLLK